MEDLKNSVKEIVNQKRLKVFGRKLSEVEFNNFYSEIIFQTDALKEDLIREQHLQVLKNYRQSLESSAINYIYLNRIELFNNNEFIMQKTCSKNDIVEWVKNKDSRVSKDVLPIPHDEVELTILMKMVRNTQRRELLLSVAIRDGIMLDSNLRYDLLSNEEFKKSKISPPIKAMVVQVCRSWKYYIDPDIGLPSPERGTTNSLIQLISLLFENNSPSEAPDMETIKNFIRNYIKPQHCFYQSI